MTPKQFKRLRDLHALVVGGATPQERESAWQKLDAFLKKHGKSWTPSDLRRATPRTKTTRRRGGHRERRETRRASEEAGRARDH
jgi:hypothetical protein